MRIAILFIFSLFLFNAETNAQNLLTTAGSTLDFDTYMGSSGTVPSGITATSANFRGVGSGTGNAGGAYSFTINPSDNSLGGLRSGSNSTIIYEIEYIYNDPVATSPITELTISYNFEQYRFANNSGIDVSGGGDLMGEDLSGLSQAGTSAGTNGIPSTTPKSITLLGLDIQPMETFSIIFSWYDDGGSDNGLAVDDLVISSIVLPVDLVTFKGKNNGQNNNISWSTAAEVNNSHFEILHSNDGRDYTNIGKVEGNGNTSEITEYTFTHENVKSGNHFYKLKQVDFDGQFEVFGPVAVNKKNTSLRFFPTTAGQSINFEGEMNDESYQIYSLEGRLIQSGKINHTIDISAIPNGMYYIKYAEKTEQLIKM